MSATTTTTHKEEPHGFLTWLKFWCTTWFYFGFPFMFWIRPKWTTKEMPSQAGKVVVITGGNSGTGYATAKAFYEAGAKVYIGCRSEERANTAIENIQRGGLPNLWGKWVYTPTAHPESVGTITYLPLDLSDFDSIDNFVAAFKQREQQLDILYANAGIMAVDEGQYTKQGHSLQFGTNVLGHQRLIKQLIPTMQATARAKGTPSRLIVVSSQGHIAAPRGGVHWDSLHKGGKILDKWADYGQSKWGDLALSRYIAKKYGPGTRGGQDGAIISTGIHPGLVATNLGTHLNGYTVMRYTPGFQHGMQVDTYTGALNQIWVGQLSEHDAQAVNGKYVSCYQQIAPQRPDLYEDVKVDRVWDWCEAQDRKNL